MKPLSKARWHQIEALLDEALDLDLRREVERLLRAESEAPPSAGAERAVADELGLAFPEGLKEPQPDRSDQ